MGGLNDYEENVEDINYDDHNYDDPKNTIIDDPVKSIEFISKISNARDRASKEAIQITSYLKNKFMNSFSSIDIGEEMDMYNELLSIISKINKSSIIKSLQNKTIVGVGGKFSSGKSRFISSIIGKYILPEDLVPTTSIPTYIVNDDKDSIVAFTKNGGEVDLIEEELEALTHKFYDKYKIGFRYIIDDIIISATTFPYKNVAILDTPGYSKDDNNINDVSVSDIEQAREQLKSSDFIIWVINIEKGTIDNTDIDFIQSLDYKKKIIFVFNQCDKKYPNMDNADELYETLQKTRDILEDKKIPFYDVIPYSSLNYYNCEYDREKRLLSFFDEADKYQNKNKDIKNNINKIIESVNRKLANMLSYNKKNKDTLIKAIYNSQNPLHIKALTALYFDISTNISNINFSEDIFKHVSKEIIDNFNNLIYKNKR